MPSGERSRRPDGLAGFPEEVLLVTKCVLRCRAVCRSWRLLTSDAAFLAEHHRHQPTLRLISSFRSTGDRLFPEWLDAVHVQRGELRPQFLPTKYMFVDASCDGLVVIFNRICNPSTRQWAPLSRKALIHKLVGLFRHQPSGECRVLFWRESSIPSERYCLNEYCVLIVGSESNPRPISLPRPMEREMIKREMPTFLVEPVLHQGQLMERELVTGDGPIFSGAPVRLHGNMHLHWRRRSEGCYHKILVLDTVAESFRHMRPPAVNPRHVMQLFDMDGTLSASCSKDAMMEMRIFVLQNYESEVWSFRFRIKLPEVELRHFQEQGDFVAKIVSEEADLLVSCFGWLLHCDRNGNLVAKFRYGDDDLPVVIPHVLKESLIQHTFFQKD